MIRYWCIILMMVFCAITTFGLLGNAHLSYRHTQSYEMYYVYICAPYLLLWMSIASWHKCYVFRRMSHASQPPITEVTKGGVVQIRYKKPRISLLERGCSMLCILALAGVLHHWHLSPKWAWMGCIVAIWFMCRRLLLGAKNHA